METNRNITDADIDAMFEFLRGQNFPHVTSDSIRAAIAFALRGHVICPSDAEAASARDPAVIAYAADEYWREECVHELRCDPDE